MSQVLHAASLKLGKKNQNPRLWIENRVRLTDAEVESGRNFLAHS